MILVIFQGRIIADFHSIALLRFYEKRNNPQIRYATIITATRTSQMKTLKMATISINMPRLGKNSNW
jgi:hypothetical protein